MSDVEKFIMMQIIGCFKQAEQNGLGKVKADGFEKVVYEFNGKDYVIFIAEELKGDAN